MNQLEAAIAKVLRKNRPIKPIYNQQKRWCCWHRWTATIDEIADLFARNNPQFDRNRFLKTAMV